MTEHSSFKILTIWSNLSQTYHATVVMDKHVAAATFLHLPHAVAYQCRRNTPVYDAVKCIISINAITVAWRTVVEGWCVTRPKVTCVFRRLLFSKDPVHVMPFGILISDRYTECWQTLYYLPHHTTRHKSTLKYSTNYLVAIGKQNVSPRVNNNNNNNNNYYYYFRACYSVEQTWLPDHQSHNQNASHSLLLIQPMSKVEKKHG
jgi:hypothetical protein